MSPTKDTAIGRGLAATLGQLGDGKPAPVVRVKLPSSRRARSLTLVWRKLVFNTRQREETWQLLSDVLSGGGNLSRMLEAVAEGYMLQGQRTVAAVLMEVRGGIPDDQLRERLAPYSGTSERILFDGLGKQDPIVIFGSAARLLRSDLAINRAISSALAMPLLLLGGFLALLMFFGLSLLPALDQVVSFDDLPPFQGWIVRTTQAFAASPLRLAVIVAGAVGGLVLAMRFWTGPGRALIDRVPPFSLLRLRAGSGFLFAVVEYGRTGEAVTTALLQRMAAAAPPYARSRINALADNFTRAGNNLGEAALMAGHGFPANDLTAVLRALWNAEDGIDRIGIVLERWLLRIEDNVKKGMAVLNVVLLTLIAAALLALMSIALPIVDQINAGIG